MEQEAISAIASNDTDAAIAVLSSPEYEDQWVRMIPTSERILCLERLLMRDLIFHCVDTIGVAQFYPCPKHSE